MPPLIIVVLICLFTLLSQMSLGLSIYVQAVSRGYMYVGICCARMHARILPSLWKVWNQRCQEQRNRCKGEQEN
jgi:hypothetical protein